MVGPTSRVCWADAQLRLVAYQNESPLAVFEPWLYHVTIDEDIIASSRPIHASRLFLCQSSIHF